MAHTASVTGTNLERENLGQRASVISIACNIVLCLIKGVVGLAGGSLSIVADALNNLSDASSNIISLLGFRLATKPADTEHPYGHGRFEYLAGLAVALLVLCVGIGLIREAVDKILEPSVTHINATLIGVLLLSIFVKLGMMYYNRQIGRRINSQTLNATAVDARNDALSTTMVLAALITGNISGLALDGWAALAVGIFVIVSGIMLVRDASNLLVGMAPSTELTGTLRKTILSYPGVLGTHDLMIHDYGPDHQFASAHVEMAADTNLVAGHEILDEIENEILKQTGIVITLHLDPININPSNIDPPQIVPAEALSETSGARSA